MHSPCSQDVYSPEWRQFKSLWGKYQERYRHRCGAQLTQESEGTKGECFLKKIVPKLSLVGEAGGVE